MDTERYSNIELFRILLMFLIIISHIVTHSVWNEFYSLSFNSFILHILRCGGGIANAGFFIITGFFMSQKQFKFDRIIKIELKNLLYSILLLLILILCGVKVSGIVFFRSFFPTLFQMNWFASCYIGLLFIMPILNVLLRRGGEELIKYTIYCLLFLTTISSLTGVNWMYDNLRYAALCYLIGGTIETIDYQKILKFSTKLNIFFIVTILFSLLVANYIPSLIDYFGYYFTFQRLFQLFIALQLFVFFKNLKTKNNYIINNTAKSCFDIYLIHDNTIMRSILYSMIFNVPSFEKSPFLLCYVIIIAIIIFFGCLLFSKVMSYIFDNSLNYLSIKLSKLNNNIHLRLKKYA